MSEKDLVIANQAIRAARRDNAAPSGARLSPGTVCISCFSGDGIIVKYRGCGVHDSDKCKRKLDAMKESGELR